MQVLYKKLSGYYQHIIDFLFDTSEEVEYLDKIFKKNQAHKILDVACGIGRHSIPLAKKGYQVTGIDFSPRQITTAKRNAKKEKANVNFVLKNANNFNFKDRFDAAICMWTTLGEEPMQYQKVIANVFNSLKEKSIFIIDNYTWEQNSRSGAETYSFSISKDGVKIKTRILDRFTENFRVRDITHRINGRVYHDMCITHMLKTNQWVQEFKKAGFKKFKVYNYTRPKNSNGIRPKRATIIAYK